MSRKFSIHPAWPHFLGLFSILTAFLAGIFRYALLDLADPLHCDALLNTGTWLDSSHRNWQPDGCMLHSYGPKDGATCLASRDVAFVGDSVTRKLFFQFARILDSTLPSETDKEDKKHQDHELQTTNGTKLNFYWDPFLNGTYITTALEAHLRNGKARPPALLVLGSGLWYLRYAATSGGIPAWEANIEQVFLKLSKSKTIADSVVILPVEELVPSKLSEERAKTMHPSDIDAMNSDLYHRVARLSPIFTQHDSFQVHLPLVFNDMLDPSATEDGIHYSDPLVKKQAEILLNLRCNDVLPKKFPFNKTCCNSYPWPNYVHSFLLFAIIVSAPLICYLTASPGTRSVMLNATNPSNLPLLVLSGGLIAIYLSDRSWLWLKEHKQFDAINFTFLCLLAVGIGLASLKRADNDLGFLNRDQTDEWKGWMQRASKVSGIYNPIRVLVASYLFMTGYGHTTFYLRKADFGFKRLAQVLIRLNLLTVLLAYVMDTDYISYYFSPLVSMWYLVIYGTMAIGSQLNSRTPILLLKILVSATLMTSFMWKSQPLEAVFSFLELIFGIRWSAREWSFRVNLDLWIVYVGMLTSIFVVKARENRLTDHRLWPLTTKIAIGGSILVLVWFFAFELCQDSKFTYNRWHPYISLLPVLAFVILRNASVILRSASSRAFAFVGRCSLETFIIQYHFWLAGDTKGVLLVIPGTRWRPANFVLTSIMFLYLSDRMAWATNQVTAWICSDGAPAPPTSLPNPVSTTIQPRGTSTANQIDREPDSEHVQEVELPLLQSKEGEDRIVEPDTPIRPSRRWIDRLAEQPSNRESSSGFLTGNCRALGLKGRVLGALLVMWTLNILWSYV
ncbi:O-acetyltransferase [Coprinopsis cinerea okayama7|uniref:O-acetyltransferase n=1 Tax=Coprinopsis cinerea (strain Okayama-7 / 130 / ATCC MYA-4618 / FGSC 9003) TaxID=240176 RepID=A8N197_COPC7|nr:O-acetyltransferase [Coprinopsis cinerea okayama7\|eukprot:XP_001828646.2 O-acetyltransferase [Coprinopsis cinerea okayama7\